MFPRIVELIYRIRNLAREAVSGNVSRDVVRELRVRVASLENGIRSLYDRIEVQHAEIIRTLAFLTGPARRG